MSLSYHQEYQIRRIEVGLRRSDPDLGMMFSLFGKLYPDQDMPAWEQVPQAASGHNRLRHAALIVAALIVTAMAIILLSRILLAFTE